MNAMQIVQDKQDRVQETGAGSDSEEENEVLKVETSRKRRYAVELMGAVSHFLLINMG